MLNASRGVVAVIFRRAVLKDCFEGLKKQIPSSEDRRSSNLDVLQMAVKYVQVYRHMFTSLLVYLNDHFAYLLESSCLT